MEFQPFLDLINKHTWRNAGREAEPGHLSQPLPPVEIPMAPETLSGRCFYVPPNKPFCRAINGFHLTVSNRQLLGPSLELPSIKTFVFTQF